MSAPTLHRAVASRPPYSVVPMKGGWAVRLEDAFTRPFRDREAAERIAARLRSQREGGR